MCRMYGGLLMTLPSTEELQRLLDEAKSGLAYDLDQINREHEGDQA